MSDQPSVVAALSAVMADVQAVGKTGRNRQQDYAFRGVDAVVNAVGPALRRHGVIVVPYAESCDYETYQTKGGTAMKSCVVKVRYVFYGPAGDTVEAVVFGESSDAGDKSTPKAHSVAFRTALLQALCIPTDEPDPDESSHERVVSDAAPEFSWAGYGWADQAEHDGVVLGLLKAQADALDEDAKATLKAEWVRRGWSLPLSKPQADEYAALLDSLTPLVSDGPSDNSRAAGTGGPSEQLEDATK